MKNIFRTIALALVFVIVHGCIEQQRVEADSSVTDKLELISKGEAGSVSKMKDGCVTIYLASEGNSTRLYKPAMALDNSECLKNVSK